MERIKQSRAASFAAVALVYVLAAAAGIAVYAALPFGWIWNLLLADVAATVLTFGASLLFGNASVYDPYWSVQPMVILAAFAAGKPMNPVRALLLAAVFLWGIRLTANWAYTFRGLTHQDWRYTMLKEKTGAFYPVINFVGIHMVPTLIVWGCVLPAVWAFREDAAWNAGSIAAFLLSLLAVGLELAADVQMHRFRRHRTGTFIRRGLWRYARHPNYLGEILMWWSVALAAVCVFPSRWYLAAGALANTVLFFAVSIPMADGRQSAKPGFEAYRAETRMLLPLPKRKKKR